MRAIRLRAVQPQLVVRSILHHGSRKLIRTAPEARELFMEFEVVALSEELGVPICERTRTYIPPVQRCETLMRS